MLQPLLTSQRVADGRHSIYCGCQLEYLFARVSAPIAAKNGEQSPAPLIMSVEQAQTRESDGQKHRRRRDADIHRFAHGLRRGDIPWNREGTVGPFSRIEVRMAVPMTAWA